MKLAVAGLVPADFRAVDDAVARNIRASGFVGCSITFQDPPSVLESEVDKLRDTLHRAGVAIAQTNALYQALVNPDKTLRQEGIAAVHAAVRIAKRLQGDMLYIRPGSLNPRGHWWPHPDNHKPETIDRLVASLRAITPLAEDLGVTLAIEGHTVSPLSTPQLVRQVIERVGSPLLMFNCDPVNFVSSVQDVYHSRRVIDGLYDNVGDRTWTVHAKDMTIEDRHVIHISEVVIGRGYMDMGYCLERFQAVRPHGYVLIEHLPDDQIPEAREALLRQAEQYAIRWEDAL